MRSRPSKQLARSILLLLWASCICHPGELVADEAGLSLAVSGEAQATIVLADQPSTAAREGAGILADHLFQICGGKFEIVNEQTLANLAVAAGRIEAESAAGNGVFILVGQSKLAQLLGASRTDN